MKKSKKQKRNFFLIYIFLPNFKLGKKVKKGEGKGIRKGEGWGAMHGRWYAKAGKERQGVRAVGPVPTPDPPLLSTS